MCRSSSKMYVNVPNIYIYIYGVDLTRNREEIDDNNINQYVMMNKKYDDLIELRN